MSKRPLEDASHLGESSKWLALEPKENVFRFYPMKSCQHMSTVSIVVAMCSRPHIRGQLMKPDDDLEEVQEILADDIAHLNLPILLKKILLNIVAPMVREVSEWKITLANCPFYLRNEEISVFKDCLVWTSRGKLDYKQITEKMLRKDKLSIGRRYSLACNFCLEREIFEIGAQMLEEGMVLVEPTDNVQHNCMVHFWSHKLFGIPLEIHDYDPLSMSFNRYCVEYCCHNINMNPVALTYLWKELNDREKERLAVELDGIAYSVDLKCIIFSQLDEKQQNQLVYSDDWCDFLLTILYDWLWWEHFVPLIRHTRDRISRDDFKYLIRKCVETLALISDNITSNYCRYDRYIFVFQNLWELTPVQVKNDLISDTELSLKIDRFKKDVLKTVLD